LTETFIMNSIQGEAFYIDLERNGKLEIYGNATMANSGNGNMAIHLNENNNGNAADGQLKIDGDWSLTKDDGDEFEIKVNHDSNIDVGGNVTINTTVFDAGQWSDGLLDIDGNGEMDVDGSLTWSFNTSQEQNDIIFDLDDNAALFIGNDDGLLTESLIIDMQNGYNFDLDLRENAKIEVYGNCNITYAAGRHFDIDLNANTNGNSTDGQLKIDGDWNITKSDGRQFRIRLNEDSDIDIGGNFTYSGTNHKIGQFTTEEIELDNNSTFDVDGSFTFSMNTLAQENDLKFNLNNNAQLILGSNVTDNHAVTMNNGRQMIFDIDNDAKWNVNGNLNVILVDSDRPSEIKLNSNNGSGAQLNITGNFDIDNNKNSDEFLVKLYQSSLLNVDGDIDITSAAASERILIELVNNSKIEIGGNFLRTGGFGTLDCNNNSTVEYNGIAAQIFAEDAGSGTDGFYYENVIINNTNGTTPQISMEGLATVHDEITFTNGIVSSDATDILVVDHNATATGANENSHVDGFVRKIGNDAFEFPVGDGGYYAPSSISSPGTSSDWFESRYINSNPNDAGYAPSLSDITLDHVSIQEYWFINRTNGSANVKVTLSWDTPRSGGVTDLTTLAVARWNGSLWADHGNGGTTGNTTAGTVITNAPVSSFSPFTLASTNTNNPLPIELLNFEVSIKNQQVDLKWSTSTEINNDYFTVERSVNGIDWEAILTANGAGNSDQIINYSDVDDKPISGLSYYRLKQTDYNGQFDYSNVVSVKYDATVSKDSGAIKIFPSALSSGNNVKIAFNNIYEEEMLLELRDITGRQFYSKALTNITDGKLIDIPVDSSLPSGVYLITATSKSQIYSQKLILQYD